MKKYGVSILKQQNGFLWKNHAKIVRLWLQCSQEIGDFPDLVEQLKHHGPAFGYHFT